MNEQELSKKIMQEIESGNVSQHSKNYFVMRALLWGLGLGVCALSAIFVFSFLLFKLRLQGVWVLPELGVGGIRDLLLSLPFFIMLYILGFSIILYWFTKSYSFAYRKPMAYTLLAIILIVTLGGFLVARTPLHLWAYRNFRGPGPINFIYRDAEKTPLHNGVLGEVVSISSNKLDLLTIFKKHCELIISDDTFFPNKEEVVAGDFIIARGQNNGNSFYAVGIKEIPADDHFLERFPEMNHPNMVAYGCMP